MPSASPPGYATVRSDANQSQISGGDADVDRTQTIGGDTAKLLGGYIPHPPPPPGFGTPGHTAQQIYNLFLSDQINIDCSI